MTRSITANGYGLPHQRIRARLAPQVATGRVRCARGSACLRAETVDGANVGGLIRADEPWDLGHDDHDRTRYQGPEHRQCNRATAGRINRRSRAW